MLRRVAASCRPSSSPPARCRRSASRGRHRLTAALPTTRSTARAAGFDAKDRRPGSPRSEYSAVEVDVAGVRAALPQRARPAGRGATQTFRVPTPTGGTERFAVQRTQTDGVELAAAHPEIGTWSGRSLDHRGTTIALDVTPMGFHASVRGPSGQGAWYVDPAYNERGTTTHLVYYGAAVDKTEAQAFVERQTREIASRGARSARPRARPARSSSRRSTASR